MSIRRGILALGAVPDRVTRMAVCAGSDSLPVG